jgi:hypothetical protein
LRVVSRDVSEKSWIAAQVLLKIPLDKRQQVLYSYIRPYDTDDLVM